ncbi:hypothetical protein LCGC14_0367970 [marine sediment metagenome]|uniref:histidine kinase n=1 Tax=marine sediment metagenome TaxID=412755 RepID=A0A0F9VT95_9ZZZZ|nr:HAMP domain-containing histidine kinase [Phycisphaerae bacterium]
MTQVDSTPTASYQLPLPEDSPEAAPDGQPVVGAVLSLSEPMLAANATWFCRLRWLVIAIFLLYGLVGMVDQMTERLLGLHSPGAWPFIAAVVLALGNLSFRFHIKRLWKSGRANHAEVDLWGQIVLDLLVLTAVVHFIGSTQTYIAFTYLFHIALACIFFSRTKSLIVTLLAILLYGACIILEGADLLPAARVFPAAEAPMSTAPGGKMQVVNFVSAVGIWLMVWYVTSRLSMFVRRRDVELAATNRRLRAALAERSRHMLRTTHELKAPFAAIHANAQLLRDGYCGELPDKAMEILRRITARCRRLTAEIQEMLQLANLTSASQAPEWADVNVAEILYWCVGQVGGLAQSGDVSVQTDLKPAPTVGVEDHLKMLFGNLLTNAVAYSNPGGCVKLQCGLDAAGPVVTIADEGIGIAAEKLPHIFEEHYRTNEAVRHNKESSGLGLAIVRQVAEMHNIRLRVDSQVGRGTTFELHFSPRRDMAVPTKVKGE